MVEEGKRDDKQEMEKIKEENRTELRKNGQEKEQEQATRNGRIGAARKQTG